MAYSNLPRSLSKSKGESQVRRTKWKEVPCLEVLEDRTVLAPVPFATITPASYANDFIGSNVPIAATFSNTGDAVGYGPFIDVELPTNGNGANHPNGLSYVPGSAYYLGSPLTTPVTVLTFDDNGHATNPFARDANGNPLVITGTPGDELVIFLFPLGSYVPGQPTSTINFQAQISPNALLNSPLTQLNAQGGFEFGNSPTGSASILGSTSSASVTPIVYFLHKTYLGLEQETATGPNFPEQYEISVEVAPGVTLTNLDLSDELGVPNGSMQFVSLDEARANNGMVVSTSLPSTSTPGGTLTVDFNQVLGTGNLTDAEVIFTFYVPEYDANGNPILPPSMSDTTLVTDDASASATYTPPPTSGNQAVTVLASTANTITAKQLATQESIATYLPDGITPTANPGPGDIIKYTINFQVSDFYALSQLSSMDTISDGQSINTAFAPTFSYTQHSYPSLTGSFSLGPTGTYSFGPSPTTPGATLATFNVSSLLESLRGNGDGDVLGAAVPDGGTGPNPTPPNPPPPGTTGTIMFETIIDQHFSPTGPYHGAAVVQGDLFSDNVYLRANYVLNNSDLSQTSYYSADRSNSYIILIRGVVSKSVYAINGTILPTNAPTPLINPGDDVTYELTYTLPNLDIQNYQLTDFLPLPVLTPTPLTFIANPTNPFALGTATFGPADTFYGDSGIIPGITESIASNSYTFNFGNFSSAVSTKATSQILFTVQINGDPTADGLFLTNLVHQTQTSNNNGSFSQQAIAPVQLDEPTVVITKGVVSTTNSGAVFSKTPAYPTTVTFAAPGTSGPAFIGTLTSPALASTPINASLSNALGGDLVKFAVVIQNLGRALDGAFDVTVNDTIPTGFEIPTTGYDLQVSYGTGASIPYTNLGLGFFDKGIELTDPSSTMGSLAPGKTSSGTVVATGLNLAVITYDLEVVPNLHVSTPLINTATLTNFASTPGGPNFVPNGLTAQTSVQLLQLLISKTLLTSNQGVIGGLVEYQVVVTFPSNAAPQTAVNVVDTLPGGLAYVNLVAIINGDPTHLSYTGNPANPTIANHGQLVTFNLGTVTNKSTNPSGSTLTFDYNVVALNLTANVGANPNATPPVSATTLQNSAQVIWNNGQDSSNPVSAPVVTIVEPKLDTTKTVNVGGMGGNPGDPVTYTITIQQDSISQANANNVTFKDVLPTVSAGGSLLLNPTFTVTDPLGQVTTANFKLTGSNASGYTLATTATGAFSLLESQPGRVITLTINGVLASNFTPLHTYTNTDDVQWTSLTGHNPGQISPYNLNSYERTGSGSTTLGELNNYDVQGSASFQTLPLIDLSLKKSVSSSQVITGSDVVYSLVLTNNGPNTATNVSVTDMVTNPNPAALTFVSLVSVSPGTTFNPSTGIWKVGTLAIHQTVTLKFLAQVNIIGYVDNTAIASAKEYDTNPANNTSSATVLGMMSPSMVSKRLFLAR